MYRKVYEITGWTFDGDAYCLEHKPDVAEEDINPIFLGSETDTVETCCVCRDTIDTTVIGEKEQQ